MGLTKAKAAAKTVAKKSAKPTKKMLTSKAPKAPVVVKSGKPAPKKAKV